MPEIDGLAEQFEQHRGHLRAVAYRMLGSVAEAEWRESEAKLEPMLRALGVRDGRSRSARPT